MLLSVDQIVNNLFKISPKGKMKMYLETNLIWYELVPKELHFSHIGGLAPVKIIAGG